jgi:uncharacterized protein YkwD
MLTTFALCAGLLLPMAEPEKNVDKTPAAAVNTVNAAATEKKSDQKTAEKTSTEKTAEKPQDNVGDKKAEQAKGKAAADKKTKNNADGKKEASNEEPVVKDDELLAIEANVVSYTNNERARYGLPPLEVDMKLVKTAREHCSWMTLNRIFQHTRRSVAENIAMGQPSSQDVVRSWMNSSGHRANILNPNHRRIGVSAYRTQSGTIYWVQQFMQ